MRGCIEVIHEECHIGANSKTMYSKSFFQTSPSFRSGDELTFTTDVQYLTHAPLTGLLAPVYGKH